MTTSTPCLGGNDVQHDLCTGRTPTDQLQVGASRACAFFCWLGCCHSQIRLIAARMLALDHSKSLLKTALLFSPGGCVPVHQQNLSLEPIHRRLSHHAL